MIGSAQLGTLNCTLGEIELGYIPPQPGLLVEVFQDNLSFTSTFESFSNISLFSDSLIFTDEFQDHVSKIAFTDVFQLIQRFDISVSPQTRLSNLLYLRDNWVLYQSLTLALHDTLTLSDGPTFPYRYDRTFVPVPSFQVFKNGPYPYVTLLSIQSMIVLDSPIFGDSEAPLNETKISLTVGGRRYSYNKTSALRHLKYEFQIRKRKYIELQNFIDNNNLNFIHLTNWKGEHWAVVLANNPIEYSAISQDWYSVILEFEGYKFLNGDYRCKE